MEHHHMGHDDDTVNAVNLTVTMMMTTTMLKQWRCRQVTALPEEDLKYIARTTAISHDQVEVRSSSSSWFWDYFVIKGGVNSC